MPIPLFPIVTALGGATAGFLVGRYMVPDSDDDTFVPGSEDGQAERGEESEFVSSSMTEAKALKILELAAGATADEIREAHRRLIQGLHLDRGGSGYLAGLINRAKAVLLDEGEKSED